MATTRCVEMLLKRRELRRAPDERRRLRKTDHYGLRRAWSPGARRAHHFGIYMRRIVRWPLAERQEGHCSATSRSKARPQGGRRQSRAHVLEPAAEGQLPIKG